jgi:hypothetical protein
VEDVLWAGVGELEVNGDGAVGGRVVGVAVVLRRSGDESVLVVVRESGFFRSRRLLGW